mmetsp:Transcript_58983/g.129247  ORF Transcript_58983/g.129247 Transcript_58983/m.129247 type:complete len:293 (-) Transcript_58983:1375-2253(-)
MALGILVDGMFRGVQSIEGRVVQVRIQTLHMLRRQSHGMHHHQNALVHGNGRRTALQVTQVGLATGDQQRLLPRLFDLDLSNGSHFDGITQGGPCSMAFPHGGFRWSHFCLSKSTPDAFLLCWSVGCRHAGTSPILANLRSSKECHPFILESSILDDEGGSAISSIVAIRRGIEGEAATARGKHVRRAAANEGSNGQGQAGAQPQVPFEWIPALFQQVHLAQVGRHQRRGASGVTGIASTFQVEGVVEAVRNDCQLVVGGNTRGHWHLVPLLLVQAHRHGRVGRLAVGNLLG